MAKNKTAFYWDEKCFWHGGGGNYAMMAPAGDLVQPMVAGGLPEAPETKRRFKNLMDVTGLSEELVMMRAEAATAEDLLRVHPKSYLDEFKKLSDAGGGELGLRTPFGRGGYEVAALSAGLVKHAMSSVLKGEVDNAYALSRPPGHHCLPDWPNGFCLMANIPIAIEAAIAAKLVERVAVIDWDVHHGNGTEAIYYNRSDVLAISIHQERCYPINTGGIEDIGEGDGVGANMNIPLPPGGGHQTYLEVIDRLVVPKLKEFQPDLVVVACGFDASSLDPLSRMMCTAETYKEMTRRVMAATGGKLVAAHEGGYSEFYVPFCGHAMLEEMAGAEATAPDPLYERNHGQQPSERVVAFHSEWISEMAGHFFKGST